ncbi:MAG: ATP-dependent RecD-like DNA helicase, partial [Hyphomicrobiales bacterium]
IGLRERLTRRDLEPIAAHARIARRMQKARVLVIDEISMLSAATLGLVDTVCRHVRDDRAPFGGLQVVLVGDFFQLPPVSRPRGDGPGGFLAELEDGDLAARFAHAAPVWRDLAPTVCYLSEQHRQEDRDFFGLLAAIRANACGPEHRRLLVSRRTNPDQLPKGCTRLYTHNAAVDRMNDAELARVPGAATRFDMTSTGPQALAEALARGCLSPARLELKEGAAVMFTRNDPAGRYANGTLGTVAGFDSETGNPVVAIRGGRRIAAEPATWSLEENARTRASITQVPLRLAWAITVHKSQGMSLDAAATDLGRAFEYGQGYVALSRLRRMDGLYLLGLNERALQVHPEAVERDGEFRRESRAALEALAALGEDGLAARQSEWLKACGARAGGSSSDKSYDVDALRETHANAYRPWSKEEEDALKQRFAAGEKVAAIAAALGRRPGAIRSRLARLGLA